MIIYLLIIIILIILWSFILLIISHLLEVKFVVESLDCYVLIGLFHILEMVINKLMIIVGLYVSGRALCAMMFMVSTRSFFMATHYNALSHTHYTSPQPALMTTHLTNPSHLPILQLSFFFYPTWMALTIVHNYNSKHLTTYQ